MPAALNFDLNVVVGHPWPPGPGVNSFFLYPFGPDGELVTVTAAVPAAAVLVQFVPVPATPPANAVFPAMPMREPTQEFHTPYLFSHEFQISLHTDFEELPEIVDTLLYLVVVSLAATRNINRVAVPERLAHLLY